MRVGKRLPKATTEIAIQFKAAPPVLFNAEGKLSKPTLWLSAFNRMRASLCA